MVEESNTSCLRRHIEEQYRDHPTGGGGSFGELLCYEIHTGGLTFLWLAEKWGISVTTLGELIWDHCKRLEKSPVVDHEYRRVLDFIPELPPSDAGELLEMDGT